MFPQVVTDLAKCIQDSENKEIYALHDALVEAGEPYLALQCMQPNMYEAKYPVQLTRAVTFILSDYLHDRRQALAQHLYIDPNEIVYTGYNDDPGFTNTRLMICRFEQRNKDENGNPSIEFMGEYIVLTDTEADLAHEDQLRQSLSSLYPHILRYSIPEEEVSDEDLTYMREHGQEDELYNSIPDWDDFVAETRTIQDRGELLNTCDGTEGTEEVNGVVYYIYQTN